MSTRAKNPGKSNKHSSAASSRGRAASKGSVAPSKATQPPPAPSGRIGTRTNPSQPLDEVADTSSNVPVRRTPRRRNPPQQVLMETPVHAEALPQAPVEVNRIPDVPASQTPVNQVVTGPINAVVT